MHTHIGKKFQLSHVVLHHTFISMHAEENVRGGKRSDHTSKRDRNTYRKYLKFYTVFVFY